jgi:ABC-type multidrug transport system fused ATPase/permease subunit
LLSGCASTDYHYSQLFGERITAADRHLPVTVVRVDGRDTTRRPALSSRARDVSVQARRAASGRHRRSSHHLDGRRSVHPYYLVAVKSQALASDFSVKVDHQDLCPGARRRAQVAFPPSMKPALLEVRNLRVEFPDAPRTLVAIDDISFEIAPGEILGVVGESGPASP